METHNLQQGTEEWHAHRAKYCNASEAPAMMGEDPNLPRSDLIRMKATGGEQEFSDYVQKRVLDPGHELEEAARPIAEEISGKQLYPVVGTNKTWSASFDGLTMDEEISFEHKTLNDELLRIFDNDEPLPRRYLIQMEQGFGVSGNTKRCLFMASKWVDGELVYRHRWIEPDITLRTEIIKGWRQFHKDVEAYKPSETPAVEVVGKTPETLPALAIEVTGMVTHSNLEEFKEHALSVFKGIKTDLQTDQDFADAEKTVKWCRSVEDRLESAKEHALGQTQSIDMLFKALDDIKAEARSVRLDLNKRATDRKQAIRGEILTEHRQAVSEHISGINATLTGIVMPQEQWADFASVMKGKKTVKGLRDACETELAQAKIRINDVADLIRVNLKALYDIDGDSVYRTLFPDLQQIVTKQADDFAAVVKTRIADHEAEQAAIRKMKEEAETAAEEVHTLANEQEKDIGTGEKKASYGGKAAMPWQTGDDPVFVLRREAIGAPDKYSRLLVWAADVIESLR